MDIFLRVVEKVVEVMTGLPEDRVSADCRRGDHRQWCFFSRGLKIDNSQQRIVDNNVFLKAMSVGMAVDALTRIRDT